MKYVDGGEREIEAPDDMPLLWVLRDLMGLTGTKSGCGIARCGACIVHIDGAPLRACITPVSAVAGRKITTIEGLGRVAEAHDRRQAGAVGLGVGGWAPVAHRYRCRTISWLLRSSGGRTPAGRVRSDASLLPSAPEGCAKLRRWRAATEEGRR